MNEHTSPSPEPSGQGPAGADPAADISSVPPETKDWTAVLGRGCRQCGFEPGFDVETVGWRIRMSLPVWQEVLARPRLSQQPGGNTWSTLEYAAHVSELHQVFRERLALMLDQDDPEFPDWDQDAAAIEQEYNRQDPAEVARQLRAEGEKTAAAWDAVQGEQWERTGRRGDGKVFTVRSLAEYFAHDLMHHRVYDVKA